MTPEKMGSGLYLDCPQAHMKCASCGVPVVESLSETSVQQVVMTSFLGRYPILNRSDLQASITERLQTEHGILYKTPQRVAQRIYSKFREILLKIVHCLFQPAWWNITPKDSKTTEHNAELVRRYAFHISCHSRNHFL